ncbi:hypothetical protein L596_030811 [Steinernema carpocapsae]|uniref:Macro domain-containing protein n=1 Tax=Steinernema carpocapsae TaxID=34508 RepID=A0A4U5LNU5_STECR|nr:hypothetical protein L596_030811 [Steinernema carpocapsae]
MSASFAQKVKLIRGDITRIPTIEVIVNAANKSLLGGGGVDGAIHRAAGPDLLEECRELGGCKTGEAKLTGAYDIKHLKGIIHTVGPIVGYKKEVTDEKRQQLQDCYLNSLDLAVENKLETIAFPCISTGIYGYPNDEACVHVLEAVKGWLAKEDNAEKIKHVVFCVFLEVDVRQYLTKLPEYFEGWKYEPPVEEKKVPEDEGESKEDVPEDGKKADGEAEPESPEAEKKAEPEDGVNAAEELSKEGEEELTKGNEIV